jgi:hypothetical protein
MSRKVKSLESEQLFWAYVREHELVAIKFGMAKCPPCKVIKPEFERLAAMTDAGWWAGSVDVTQSAIQPVADTFQVEDVPVFHFFHNGEHLPKLTYQGADAHKLKTRIADLKLCLKHATTPRHQTQTATATASATALTGAASSGSRVAAAAAVPVVSASASASPRTLAGISDATVERTTNTNAIVLDKPSNSYSGRVVGIHSAGTRNSQEFGKRSPGHTQTRPHIPSPVAKEAGKQPEGAGSADIAVKNRRDRANANVEHNHSDKRGMRRAGRRSRHRSGRSASAAASRCVVS